MPLAEVPVFSESVSLLCPGQGKQRFIRSFGETKAEETLCPFFREHGVHTL